MRRYHRAYEEGKGDFARMWSFLKEDYAHREHRFIWTNGRLGDFKFGLWREPKYFPSFLRNNAQLWLNDFDELIGFVLAENCDSYFTVFAKFGHDFLYPEMLEWVKNHWGDRDGSLHTDVHEGHDTLIRAMEQAGFSSRRLAAITRQYEVSDLARIEPRLPSGYVVRDMKKHPDYEAKVALNINAWSNRTDEVTLVDRLQHEYNREHPMYAPELDLSVIGPDGRHLASCQAFVDDDYSYAEIEKVCTHSDFRRLGLATAVIRECIKRLEQRGTKHAYITGLSPETQKLYGSFGTVSKSVNLHAYELD